MYIVKRDGRKEELDLVKIQDRISKVAKGLDVNFYDIILETVRGLYDGVSSIEIDNESANISANYSYIDNDYNQLAANILISRLHKESPNSIREYLNVFRYKLNSNTISIIEANIEELEAIVDYNRDFNFDFLAVKSLQKLYLLKQVNGNKEIYERPQQMYIRIACSMINDINLIKEWYDLLSNKLWSPASPIMINGGTINNTYISCNLTWLKGDSLEEIMDTMKDISRSSADAAGIGLGISNIRSSKTSFNIHNGKAHGVVKLARIVNELMRA